jgi:hypothetical protein
VITVELANAVWLDWSQEQVTAFHYLHAPVDPRCKPLAYTIIIGGVRVGCLIFGRPEATRCYRGTLRYGSVADVAAGRATYTRWEVLNLARVWLDPKYQKGGIYYVRNALSQAAAAAFRLIVLDYLVPYPPCFLDEPWQIHEIMSYCDTKLHTGSLYRALNFRLAYTNDDGIETYALPVRGLQTHERRRIERLAEQSPRSRHYRSVRAVGDVVQEVAL